MTKAATHDGHCQICDRFHRLPGGVVSKHGYEVKFRGYGGYFAGTCGGAGSLPFEQDCTLARDSIVSAKKSVKNIERLIKDIRKPVTEPKSVWNHYVGHPIGYVELPCEVTAQEKNGHTSYYANFEWDGKPHQEWLGRHSIYGRSVLEVTQELQERKAKRLERHIVGIREYIKWQTERVANWKPAKLKPRKGR